MRLTPRALAAVLIAAATCCLAASGAAEPAAPSPPGFRILSSRPVELVPHPPLLSRRLPAATSKAAPGGLRPYTFFPQAGRLGRDLFLYNGTDVDPLRDRLRDFECTLYTYDGHHGHDVIVRSFREVEIGIPVFAVLDGTVLETHDGEPDRNVHGEPAESNYVVLDHGGGHLTLYYHLARGSVAVAPGAPVVAGQQIALTASSGTTTWPHLHFESWLDGRWYEPSSGACSEGPSQWRSQPAIEREFAVSELYLTAGQIPFATQEDAAGDLDPRLRTGTFVTGPRRLMGRLDMHNVPGGAFWRVLLRDPRDRIVADVSSWSELPDLVRVWIEVFELQVDFDRPGTWRLQLEMDHTPVLDAPIRVVANPRAANNRPPNRVGVGFAAPPRAGEVATCQVETSQVHEDPDYDLVRYRYRWSVKQRVLREVTTAALSDHLRHDLLRAGEPLTCKVTPHDGRVAGKPAQASAKVAAANPAAAAVTDTGCGKGCSR